MDVHIADPSLGETEQERVRRVIESGQLAAGDTVRQFETEFAEYCGTDHAVATCNGTAALHTALRAVGVGPGDVVVTTPFTFVATANAVRLCGARPVFADVDPTTYNVDPHDVDRLVREHDADAILPVHLYGLPADVAHLADVADTHDVALVEDAAQAHGATFEGERVGSFGDAATFSFYPTKNMTTGEGGVVTTDRADVAERAARFVNHGRADTYEHVEVGHNFRMLEMAAAIGRVQIEKLPGFVEARQRNAERLTRALDETPLELPSVPANRTHAYHQYTVACDDRDDLRRNLDAKGVGTGVYYPKPVHRQPAYDDFDCEAPAAERASDRVLSLPVHPNVSEEGIDFVVDSVREHYGVA